MGESVPPEPSLVGDELRESVEAVLGMSEEEQAAYQAWEAQESALAEELGERGSGMALEVEEAWSAAQDTDGAPPWRTERVNGVLAGEWASTREVDVGAALAARTVANDEREAALLDLGVPDRPSTPEVDEHAKAADLSADHQGLSDTSHARAATLAARAYPEAVGRAFPSAVQMSTHSQNPGPSRSAGRQR